MLQEVLVTLHVHPCYMINLFETLFNAKRIKGAKSEDERKEIIN